MYEKNPATKTQKQLQFLYTLKVGESVTIPRRNYDSISVCTAFRTRKLGFKFRRKMEGDSVRVWRIS
jgi:hypothetical protein